MRRLLLLCSTVVTLMALAGPAKRPADWTLEERLAKRFNAADIAARDRAYRDAHPEIANDEGAAVKHLEPGQRMVAYVIDGSRNPELFLPHELFGHLVATVTLDEPTQLKQKEFYRAGIRQFFGEDALFWNEIARVSSPLRTVDPSKPGQKCRAQHAALTAVRSRFGAALFDEFLYSVIAPTMWCSDVSTSTDPQTDLRQAEWGCEE